MRSGPTPRRVLAVAVLTALVSVLMTSPAHADPTVSQDSTGEATNPDGFDVGKHGAIYRAADPGNHSVQIVFGLLPMDNPSQLDAVTLVVRIDTNQDDVADLVVTRPAGAGSTVTLSGPLTAPGGPAVDCHAGFQAWAAGVYGDTDLSFEVPAPCLGDPGKRPQL